MVLNPLSFFILIFNYLVLWRKPLRFPFWTCTCSCLHHTTKLILVHWTDPFYGNPYIYFSLIFQLKLSELLPFNLVFQSSVCFTERLFYGNLFLVDVVFDHLPTESNPSKFVYRLYPKVHVLSIIYLSETYLTSLFFNPFFFFCPSLRFILPFWLFVRTPKSPSSLSKIECPLGHRV